MPRHYDLPAVPEEAAFFTVDDEDEQNNAMWKFVPESLRTIIGKDELPSEVPPPGTVGVRLPARLHCPKSKKQSAFKSVAHSIIFAQRLRMMAEETERDRIAALDSDRMAHRLSRHRFRTVVHGIVWANRLKKLSDGRESELDATFPSRSDCSTATGTSSDVSTGVSLSSEGLKSKCFFRKVTWFRSRRARSDRKMAFMFSSVEKDTAGLGIFRRQRHCQRKK